MLFKRPLADWPLILCGPMLRRVRPSSVCVFVALRYPTRVTVTVVGPPGPIASRTADTLAFGAHLHALALDVLIAPADELQPGVLYTYNVEFSYVDAVGSARTTDLASEGMLSSPYRLGYADGALPSFSLPPGLEHLNIVHGSCRKPHAPGVDALAIADAMLAAERTDPLARPHHLLLTGDQIYADDVDASLLASLTDTGEELVGWSSPEELPGSAGGVVPWDPEVRPGIDRGDFAFEQTRFTSTALDTQLLFLSEYYAMYLFTWSDALWVRDSLGCCTLAEAALALSGGYKGTPCHEGTATPRRKDGSGITLSTAEADRKRTILFAATLPRVRRVLANIPTMMILDDHEVTDDWYLNQRWSEEVGATKLGRRVVRNALIAYAVFQDWGNHPENYEAPGSPGQRLFEAIQWAPGRPAPTAALIDTLLDLFAPLDRGPPAARAVPPRGDRMCWDWCYDGPEHRIIALDTHTWREHTAPGYPRAPLALMAPEALDKQLDERRPAPAGPGQRARLGIVISPVPVIGMALAEDMGQRVLMGLTSPEEWLHAYLPRFIPPPKRPEEWDNEPWAGNHAAHQDLLRRLSKFERVIVLSGDVHYAFTRHMAYFRDDDASPRRARVVQLTASAFKNQTEGTKAISLAAKGGDLVMLPGGWLVFDHALGADFSNRVALHLLPTFALSPLHLLWFELNVRGRLEEPAVLPASGWCTALDDVLAVAVGDDGRPKTVCRYQIAAVIDERLGPQGLAPSPWTNAVGVNNLGRFRFQIEGGDAVEVVHELHWVPPELSFELARKTEHRAPLTLPDETERPEVRS